MPVDGLTNASHAQAVQPVVFDIGGENMDDMVTIDNGDEEIKDVSFVFLVPFWPSPLFIPIGEFLVIVGFPMLIGFFQASHVHLMLCQIISSLAEYFQLFLMIVANLLVLSCNSCQSLCDEEEFLPSWGAVPFESSTH